MPTSNVRFEVGIFVYRLMGISMLALSSPQILCLPPGHANTPWIFQACRRHCWRRPSRKAFALRRVTPTRPGFSRPANVYVGVDLPAKPLPFVESRQHAPDFPGRPTSMLASTFPQSLCPSSSHANTPRIFQAGQRLCWRRPSRKAFALRRVTPARPGFSRPTNVRVGANLPAKPLSSVWSRQHAPDFSGLPASMLTRNI